MVGRARFLPLAAGAVAAVLVAVASGYGYHRDELYFLAAGHHLAWGYPDQPTLVPFLARVLSGLAPGSVAVLRIPSAFAAGAVVVLTGALAAELDAPPAAQLLASSSMAVAGVLLGAGHLLSTTTYDLLAWTLLLWLIVRLLRGNDDRLWLVIGVAAGAGLFATDLVAFLMAAVVVGIGVAGPRWTFRSPWLWLGGAIAAVAWSPYLAWQSGHGWPQLAVGRAIAAGSSASSTPRGLFLPEQLGLVSPFLARYGLPGSSGCFATLTCAGAVRSLGLTSPSLPSSRSPAASPTTWPGCFRSSWPPVRHPPLTGCSAPVSAFAGACSAPRWA